MGYLYLTGRDNRMMELFDKIYLFLWITDIN